METVKQEARNTIEESRNYYNNLLKELDGKERRMNALADYCDSLPAKIKARVLPSVYFSGITTWVIFRPKFDSLTQHDTMLITAWCGERSKFDFSKEVNESTGTWNHKLKRWIGNAFYVIEFESTSDIDGCEIIKVEEEVKETRVRYEVKC